MGAAVVNIINPDGTVIALGGKTGDEDYTKCFIATGEYSDEYQGASQVNLTVHTNRALPVSIGARIFYDEPDGAGGYIMLSPPSIERISNRHFIYEFIFLGNIHLLETKLFFNQDLKGGGWNLSFSLVGKAEDFLDLICTNMNRTQPVADPISETWEVGTVDDTTSELLIDFDNDNCLTALRKVSEAFSLPYSTSLSGNTITLHLTNQCRVHDHAFTIGDGLASFKMVGDSDRPFATVLHVLGGMQNIPYDYQEGLRRLRAGTGTLPDEEEIVYDDGTSTGTWHASKGNTITGVNVSFSNTNLVYHGSSAMRIYPNSGYNITGQIVQVTNTGTPYLAENGTLHLWVALEGSSVYDFTWSRLKVSVTDNGIQHDIELVKGMHGFNTIAVGWQHIIIPLKDFGCTGYLIEGVKITTSGYWVTGAILHVDYIYIAIKHTLTTGFIYDEDAVAEHGRIEAVAINEDIYPKGGTSEVPPTVTTKVSEYKFTDSGIDFDLNEKDIEGNTIYLFAGVEPRINFTSGNLSGYSFAMKAFTTATNEIEIVPYTDDNGQKLPDEDNAAFQFTTGDTYVITEIKMPDSYITQAEEDLLEWGQDQYVEYVADNEVAEVEVDPVWVRQAVDLQYTLLGESPVTHYDLTPTEDLFKAGDLVTITIEGLFSRRLRVTSVTHEFYSKNAVWRLTLGNYAPINIPGRLFSELTMQGYRLTTTNGNLKLVKYFRG